MTAHDEIREFGDTAVGQLWRWVVGGLPSYLTRQVTGEVIEDTLRMLVDAVRNGSDPHDILMVRDQLKARLARSIMGKPMGPA